MIIPNKIKHIMTCIKEASYKSFIVGGSIRDHFMGVEPHDYDIFTDCPSETLLNMFPRSKVLGGEERQEKILTVMIDGVEVSQFRSNGDRTEVGNTLEEHQATCDFLLNAIAMDIDGELAGDNRINSLGMYDIEYKLLRFVGKAEDRIKEDKLRVLRGIRFTLKYNLEMDFYTADLLQKTDLSSLPKERVREELMKILSLDLKPKFLTMIKRFLPEEVSRSNMFKNGGKHHSETPFKHLEYSFLEISKITNDPLLRLSSLLHDVGKEVTRTEEEGKVHFYEHHKAGADIVRKWMEEYKFSKEEIKYVTCLIYNHMHSYNGEEPSKRSYIKLFKDLEDNGVNVEDFVMLRYSDNQGNLKNPRILFGDFIKDNKYIKKYYELKFSKEPFRVGDLVVGGKDLIERYNITPGPIMGEILKAVLEKILDGDLRNERAEIFHYIEGMKTVGKDIAITIDKKVLEGLK